MLSLIPVEAMKWYCFACLSLTVACVTPAWCQDERRTVCEMPAELTVPSGPLPRVASALATKRGLDIFALGSGSTVGDTGTSGGAALSYHVHERSFPYRMVDALRSMRPGLRFNLMVGGGRDMTADEMLPILEHALANHHFDLVLWQTGTVEAVQGLRPDALRGVLEDGADAVDEAHADLVLIDPQFSRFLRANADLSPYETVPDADDRGAGGDAVPPV